MQISSRKLAGVIAAILGVVTIVIGLAFIHPAALTNAERVVGLAIVGVVGLGGFQIYRQGTIDEKQVS